MKNKFFRLICTILALLMLVLTFACCDNKSAQYDQALALLESGDYAQAYEIFKTLGDYKDTAMHLDRFVYYPTVASYTLSDRSGEMTVTLGEYNLPANIRSEGTIGVKDGVCTYDSKGNLAKHVLTYNDVVYAYDYYYDQNNYLTRAVYSEDGVVLITHDYTNDDNGKILTEVYTQNGSVGYQLQNDYDDNGNLTFSEIIYPDITYKYYYTYDDNGKRTNYVYEESTGVTAEWVYTYNQDGSAKQEVCTAQGYTHTLTYFYDDNGNCIKEEVVYGDNTKDVTTREFDKFGNVTKIVITYADQSVQSVEWQYALTYHTIDVPAWTKGQVWELLRIL